MNFRQIEAFSAVMSVGTTTGAAKLLGISQPAVSRLLAQLERTTGLKLFDRAQGRLTPTQEGSLFHREVARSLVVLDRLKVAAHDILSFGTGTLRVAALPALGFSLIPRVVSRFLEQHPDQVSVTMETGGSETVRELIASGQFDVGFAAEEIETAGLVHGEFATPPAVCVLPAGHPLARKSMIEAADLNGESFVALSKSDRMRQRIDAALERAGAAPRIVVETHFALSICQFVQQGAGIGLINPYCLDSVSPEGIAVRPFQPLLFFRTLLIMPPQRPASQLASDFAAIARRMAKPVLDDILGRFGLAAPAAVALRTDPSTTRSSLGPANP
jgi:DNA-binding transcriptional LysR family regulator